MAEEIQVLDDQDTDLEVDEAVLDWQSREVEEWDEAGTDEATVEVQQVDEASWGPKTWKLSRDGFMLIVDGSLSTKIAIKEETNEDKSGKPATAPLTIEDQEITFSYYCNAPKGKVKPAEEFESWRDLLGHHYPFYFGGERFGPEEVMVKEVSLDDEHHWSGKGKFLWATITVTFKEYSPEKSKDKKVVNPQQTSKTETGRTSNNNTRESAASVGPNATQRAQLKG